MWERIKQIKNDYIFLLWFFAFIFVLCLASFLHILDFFFLSFSFFVFAITMISINFFINFALVWLCWLLQFPHNLITNEDCFEPRALYRYFSVSLWFLSNIHVEWSCHILNLSCDFVFSLLQWDGFTWLWGSKMRTFNFTFFLLCFFLLFIMVVMWLCECFFPFCLIFCLIKYCI